MKNMKLILAAAIITLSSFTISNAQTISLTSKGEVEVIPDIASTNISISKTNKNVDVLRKEILQISKDLNKELSKLNINKKDIQTSNLQINKEYDWVKSEKVFKGYRANINTSVTFRDVRNLEKIYTQLLSNEDVIVNGIQYDYSKKIEAQNEAYVKALNNANILADKLYNEIESNFFNLSSEPKIIIQSISNNGETPSSTPRPMYKAALSYETLNNADIPSVDINVGTITYSKSLTIVYNRL